MTWGAEDAKMISMDLGSNGLHGGQMGNAGVHQISHDPSYSPHQESMGSDGGNQDDQDHMHQDSKRKRKYLLNYLVHKCPTRSHYNNATFIISIMWGN